MGDTVRTLQRDGQIYLRVDGGVIVALAAVGVVVQREGILCVLTLACHRQRGSAAAVVGDGQCVSAELFAANPDVAVLSRLCCGAPLRHQTQAQKQTEQKTYPSFKCSLSHTESSFSTNGIIIEES